MAKEVITNDIGLITKWSTEAWDQIYKSDSRSSLLDQPGKVRFSIDNARTVKVAKSTFGGLTDYNRNNAELGADEPTDTDRGYKEAAMDVTWEERTLRQDRAAKYVIENFDNEETNGLAIGMANAEIMRTVVIPEVDAYCFSEIAGQVKQYNLGNYVDAPIAEDTELSEFNKGIKWLDDAEVLEGNRIAFVSTDYINHLRSTKELIRRLDVEGVVDHKVSFKIVSYENINLVVVPPRRFHTEWTKRAKGGYYYPTTSKPIDFILMDKGAATHVVKYKNERVLKGDAALANTDMDSTVIYVRVYHDLFVFDNKVQGIYVHVGGYTDTVKQSDFGMNIDGKGNITAIFETPAGTRTSLYKTTAETVPAVGTAFTKGATETKLEVGSTLAKGANKVIAVQGGEVVAVKTYTLSGNAGSYSVAVA